MSLILRSTNREPWFMHPEALQEWLWNAAQEDSDVTTIGLAADMYETDESVTVEMLTAGLKPEEVSLSFANGVLTVSGERKHIETEEKRNYYQRQIHYGSFSHSFTLPDGADVERAEASLENGHLKVQIPKSEAAKPRQITIKAN